MPGVKIKSGNSPFKFDNAIDLRTINISLIQQIYGPLMIDIESNVNIDNSSENYGEYFDTKLGLLWQKRAYEFGIYYHPDNDAGGIYFRLNGFNFGNSVKPVFQISDLKLFRYGSLWNVLFIFSSSSSS